MANSARQGGPDGGDGGWGGNSGGGGGSDNSGGPGRSSVPGLPPTKTMPPQTGKAGCVPASLTVVKMALCNGNGQTEGDMEGAMWTYAMQQFGTGVVNDGVPPNGMAGFVNHFFNTTSLSPAGNYQGAINAGQPIMLSFHAGNDTINGVVTQIWHSVVVTGYNPANPTQIYYLDPLTGRTETGIGATMFTNSLYAIPVTSCK